MFYYNFSLELNDQIASSLAMLCKQVNGILCSAIPYTGALAQTCAVRCPTKVVHCPSCEGRFPLLPAEVGNQCQPMSASTEARAGTRCVMNLDQFPALRKDFQIIKGGNNRKARIAPLFC